MQKASLAVNFFLKINHFASTRGFVFQVLKFLNYFDLTPADLV